MHVEEIVQQLTLEEKAALCSGKDFWKTKAIERLHIPSVMMCDGPHGLRKQVGEGDHLGIHPSIETVCYPSASALASSFDRDLLKQTGTLLGKECRAEGVSMLLGPGVNIKRSPLCGRNFEYFSEDPYLAGEMGAAYVQGLQEQGVSACVKHFAANNQETRRMTNDSQVDERTLHEIYLPAFEAVVKKGKTGGVMCAYNSLNGQFCAENRTLLTDILRKQWGYKGIVVTDWGAVKDRVEGIRAGLDLEMPGGPGAQDQEIVEAVRSGRLSMADLDQAIRNLLNFLEQYASNPDENSAVNRVQMSLQSERICEQCAVLLKNEDLLPLHQDARVVLIGEFAKTPRYQGNGSSRVNVAHPVSACKAAPELPWVPGYRTGDAEPDQSLIEQARQAAAAAQTAVIFAGQPDADESEGRDRITMELPANQTRLIEAVAEVQPNTVVVLHNGSPLVLPWIDKVKAILLLHLGGERTGEAAIRLLYGKANPSGKLAETWPLRLEDTSAYLNFPGYNGVTEYREGIYVGYRYYDKRNMPVQFSFGFGLSYTTFAYSNLQLTTAADGLCQVCCQVTNTGTRAGSEVVQLYLSKPDSAVARPLRELKGFEKVYLEPGESAEVRFVLEARSFAYYEPRIHDWYVEAGTYIVQIGASSRDIRLQASLSRTASAALPVQYTWTTTLGELSETEEGREALQEIQRRLFRSREAVE